jgi:hypothetical protein
MIPTPRRAWALAALSTGLVAAAACGGSVRAENGGDMGSVASSGAGAEGADAGAEGSAVGATNGSSVARGCTSAPGGSSSSGSGANNASGAPTGRDVDLCKGDVPCGVGLFCETPQQCCIPDVAVGHGVDPANCLCGVVRVVVGTHCAASCFTTPQQCFQDPGGKNTDCPAGQACLNVTTTQVGDVPVVLATCGPSGTAGSGSSSSGASAGAGSCVNPGGACGGALVECSSALSCAPGDVCCETTVTNCAECPPPPPCEVNCVPTSSGG